ncbi:MAG: 4Fe-4S dicluster domain-containing protein [Methanospirillaceae archaeon]|nr:4Fe-4S dicluster domain-containing protein [Methanospirillaceae archaeon]
MKTVFVRQERCVGCRHCEVACAIEHSLGRNLLSAIQEKKVSYPRIYVESDDAYQTFPNRCRHCDPAPCMQVCPTGALYRDEETGSVLVAYEKCIQCAVCAMACPFGIISFSQVHELDTNREVNTKCDDCIRRQREGSIPACAEACKTGALIFGDADDLIRTSRIDFTARLIGSRGAEISLPAVPENVSAYRKIMETVAGL